MIKRWEVIEPVGEVRHCIVGLAGRGLSNDMMANVGHDLCIPNTLIVSLEPKNQAWYPLPTSSYDQDEAVAGLPVAVEAIESRVSTVMTAWGLKKNNICLMGFSAGAVVAIQTALNSDQPYHSVISYAGAIFEPDQVPPANGVDTHFLLQHNKDDFCFEWHERYIPMKRSLLNQGYDVSTLEGYGGHTLYRQDIIAISNCLLPLFGYQKLRHPRSDEIRKRVIKQTI